jgi:hypothetical protein
MKFFKQFFALVLTTAAFINACGEVPVIIQNIPITEIPAQPFFFDKDELPATILDRNEKPVIIDKDGVGGQGSWDTSALSPAYPVLGYSVSTIPDPKEDLKNSFGGHEAFIIKKSGKFYLVNSKDDLKHFYAPINSEQEALSFAILSTGSKPIYDLKGYEFRNLSSKVFERSHVEKVSGGYIVNLFENKFDNCGYMPMYGINYMVTDDGDVKTLSKNFLYEVKSGCVL